MQLRLNIVAGACALAIPIAATAQMPPPAEPAQPENASQTQTQSKQVIPATAADLKAGVLVYDAAGKEVGKIESVDAKGAVVNTGTASAQIALSSFGKSDKGLVISMTRAELEAAAKEKAPK